MGFLLIGLSLDSVNSIFSSLLFLVVYLIMTVLFFGLLLSLKHFTQNFQVIFLTDLYSLDKNGSVLNFL
jgi:NADH:ubiquinone oxidoreductase subunit 2 (subunit N)